MFIELIKFSDKFGVKINTQAEYEFYDDFDTANKRANELMAENGIDHIMGYSYLSLSEEIK